MDLKVEWQEMSKEDRIENQLRINLLTQARDFLDDSVEEFTFGSMSDEDSVFDIDVVIELLKTANGR